MNTKVMLNKILVILLSTFLLLGTISIKSFADIEEAERGEIIVEDVESGVKVSVYRLTSVNYDFNKKGSNQPYEPPYEWNESVKNWLQTNYNEYVDPEKFQEKVLEKSTEAANFYDDLAAAIRSKKITLSEEGTGSATGGTPGVANQTVKIDKLEMGTYLVLIENGYKVYKPSVVNLVPTFDETTKTWKMTTPAKVEIKSSEPKIVKEVTDEDVSTTDTITYTVTADVPKFPTNSLAKNYCISDIFGNGLKYVGDVEVYGVKNINEEQSLQAGDNQDYTLVTDSAKRPCDGNADATFSIKFNYDKISSYDKVKVVYKAKLKQDTSVTLAGEGNKNTVYLDYSNNPYDVKSWNTKSTDEIVYTYEVQISKVDKNELFLTGAHFTIAKETDRDNPIKFVRLSDGTYYQSNEEGAKTDLIVSETDDGTKGKLYIRGLDTGKYYLTETVAPDGYNKLSQSVEITIDHGNNQTLKVENNKGFVLPLTGGIGATVFTVIGSILFGTGLLLGIVMIIKKSSLNKDIK